MLTTPPGLPPLPAPAAAVAEFDRWSTACDTRREPHRSSWVCRRDDAGEWVETTAHPSIHEAERARTVQALAAVLTLPEVAAWCSLHSAAQSSAEVVSPDTAVRKVAAALTDNSV